VGNESLGGDIKVRNRTARILQLRLISLAVASCFFAELAFANPTGPTAVNGTAAFRQSGNLLQITNSPNSIIHWQSLSIGASEITRFLRQPASSAVLSPA
jgi:hypothetical protein